MGLPSKIALACTLCLVFVVALVSTIQLLMFRENLQQTLFTEQGTMTALAAENLDQQLVTLKNALLGSAKAVTEADVASSEAAQKYLDTNAGLNAIFERSVFLFSPTGRLIAERPYLPNRRGDDVSWRDYNREALRTRGPVISEPFVSTKADKHVVIMFATPVFSKDGSKIIAINTGSLGLTNPQLLGNIAKTVVGRTGFMYIVTKDGKVVMHPDRSLLLKRAYQPGANPLFERALAGFEGSGHSIERDGRRAISTFKRIPSTGWLLATVYPEDEAFESFNVLARNLAIIFAVSLLLSCGIVWSLTHDLVLKIQSKNELLKRLRSQSVSQLKAKSRFFSEASHDLKQRLYGMQLLVNMVEREKFQTAPVLFPKLREAIADLQRYLSNFLEITQLETSLVETKSTTVALQDIFQRLDLQFEEVASERGIELRFRYTNAALLTDQKMLSRVLENLVSNAVKFARTGVLVSARTRSEGVLIEVYDDGMGIAEEERDQIFGAFFQGREQPQGSSESNGFGLGLSIVHRLVKLLDARVSVRSHLGRGTVVKVLFPQQQR